MHHVRIVYVHLRQRMGNRILRFNFWLQDQILTKCLIYNLVLSSHKCNHSQLNPKHLRQQSYEPGIILEWEWVKYHVLKSHESQDKKCQKSENKWFNSFWGHRSSRLLGSGWLMSQSFLRALWRAFSLKTLSCTHQSKQILNHLWM